MISSEQDKTILSKLLSKDSWTEEQLRRQNEWICRILALFLGMSIGTTIYYLATHYRR